MYKEAWFYGIPESTLRDRTLGLQPVEDDVLPTPGPHTTLSREEERMLIGHMEYMNSIGYGYSRQELLNLATDFAISLKKKSPEDLSFTQAWFDGLKGRWPGIRLAKPQKLSVVHAKSASQPVIEKYYAELGAVMTEINYLIVLKTFSTLTKQVSQWNIHQLRLLCKGAYSSIYNFFSWEKSDNHCLL